MLDLYQPTMFDHSLKVAESIWKSRAVQKPWLPNPEAVLFVMQRGLDLRISPLVALEHIFKMERKSKSGNDWVVTGTWGIQSHLARGICLRDGIQIKILEETDKLCRMRFYRPAWEEAGNAEHIETVTFDDLLKISGGKDENGQKIRYVDSHVFRQYPRQIFRAVAFRRGSAVVCADTLLGLVPVDTDVESRFVEEDEVEGDQPQDAPPSASETQISAQTLTEGDHRPKRGWPQGKPRGKKPAQETGEGANQSSMVPQATQAPSPAPSPQPPKSEASSTTSCAPPTRPSNPDQSRFEWDEKLGQYKPKSPHPSSTAPIPGSPVPAPVVTPAADTARPGEADEPPPPGDDLAPVSGATGKVSHLASVPPDFDVAPPPVAEESPPPMPQAPPAQASGGTVWFDLNILSHKLQIFLPVMNALRLDPTLSVAVRDEFMRRTKSTKIEATQASVKKELESCLQAISAKAR